MIKLYLQNYWAKAVMVVAFGATIWYLFTLYQQVYAPLFMTEPPTTVTSSQFNIPQTQIDTALAAFAAKDTNAIDFSTITATVTEITTTESLDNIEAGTEGITVDETAP